MINTEKLKEIYKKRRNGSAEIAELVRLITEEGYKPDVEEMYKVKDGLNMTKNEASSVFFAE